MAERRLLGGRSPGRRFFPAAGHYRLADGLVKDALRAAARPVFARSWTRLPARAGWQLSGKGSRKRVCGGIGEGRRVGGRPGSGFPEELVLGV